MKPSNLFRQAFLAVMGLSVLAFLPFQQAFAQDSEPSFEQVLAAPDDIQLNLAYAQARAKAGDLLTAAAALERVLSAHPGAASVRLYYATLLYRLDDQQGARAQLKLLEGAPLPPLQDKEREKYLRLTASAQKQTKISGQVSAGIGYDSDAMGALLNQFDFLPLSRKPGASQIYSARVDVTSELRPGLDLYGSLSGRSQSDISGPTNALQGGEIRLGLSETGLHTGWSVGGVARHYLLDSIPYLTEYGGQGSFHWRPDTAFTLTPFFEVVQQNYHEPAIDALATLGSIDGTHDGMRVSFGLGADYRITQQLGIGAVLGFEHKIAGYKPFSYDSPFISGTLHSALGRGIYVDVTGSLHIPEYRAVDTFFLGAKRRSVLSDVGISLGVPLSAFAEGGVTANEFENVALVAGLTYGSRDENTPLQSYESAGGSLKLVWRFGDGN